MSVGNLAMGLTVLVSDKLKDAVLLGAHKNSVSRDLLLFYSSNN